MFKEALKQVKIIAITNKYIPDEYLRRATTPEDTFWNVSLSFPDKHMIIKIYQSCYLEYTRFEDSL